MATAVPKSSSSNIILQSIQGTTGWSSGSLSFFFPTSSNRPTVLNNYPADPPGTFSGDLDWLGTKPRLKADINEALGAYHSVASLNFTPSANFAQADLKFVGIKDFQFTDPGPPSETLNIEGYANFPGTSVGGNDSYVFYSTTDSNMAVPPSMGGGHYRMWTVLHELGHALGLGHPHDTGNGTTEFIKATPLDNEKYTVMSYNSASPGVFASGHAVTPMALDIAALQAMYGISPAGNGNTTYYLTDPGTKELQLDPSTGKVRIGAAYYCIWDTFGTPGGTDTIRYDGTAQVILNLNAATLSLTDGVADQAWIGELVAALQSANLWTNLPTAIQTELSNAAYHAGGFFSSIIGPVAGGYSIANGAEIENAQGGSGGDFLIGNSLENVLYGNAGADFLYGGASDDILDAGLGTDYLLGGDGVDTLQGGKDDDYLVGGSGNVRDHLKGGLGRDTADYSAAPSRVVVDLALGTATGGLGPDILDSVENILGSAFNDVLKGNALQNRLEGGGGKDILQGANGSDTLLGGNGNDKLTGGLHADLLTGGAGADTFYYTDFFDSLPGFVTFSGATPLTFVVERIGNTSGAQTVNWAVQAGGGIDATDFTGGVLPTGSVTFAAGETKQSFTVFVLPDYLAETNELVTVQLSGQPASSLLNGGLGYGIILDDDGGGGGASSILNAAVPTTDPTQTYFNLASDIAVCLEGGGRRCDVIMDFSSAQNDIIDLSSIDANVQTVPDDLFQFIGTGIFTENNPGQLRYNVAGPITFIQGEITGDTISDFQIELRNVASLLPTDFVL